MAHFPIIIEPNEAKTFIESMKLIAERIHTNAASHGFWEVDLDNTGEKIALIHSELSEALEGIRHGNPPDQHCPEFSSAEIEMADTVIRIMDLCKKREWRLGAAIIAKHAFNAERPHKHGKLI